MSMVGYVLGLGDRHPSNLMLHRHSGKVVHIDFGDCFDVAMQREKYPEKVPFRLTRMLVNAMEVSGIDGNFRTVCEEVLGLMRREKDSLIAMLEAFVHDPLISWRLVTLKSHASNVASSGPSHPDGSTGSGTAAWVSGSLRVAAQTGPLVGSAVGSMLSRSLSLSEAEQSRGSSMAKDYVNKTARTIIRRISTKLTGTNYLEEGVPGDRAPVRTHNYRMHSRAADTPYLCPDFLLRRWFLPLQVVRHGKPTPLQALKELPRV